MSSRKFSGIALLVICAAALLFGIGRLFELRFESGDVYPAYSSLRADPLGTRALFESLEKISGLSVRRDFSAANQLPDGRDTTYLHLAAPAYEWRSLPTDTFNEIEQFLARGGRLVITFFPESTTNYVFYHGANEDSDDSTNSPSKSDKSEKKIDKAKPDKSKPNKPKSKQPTGSGDEENDAAKKVSLAEKWGIGFVVHELEKDEHDTYKPVMVMNQSSLPLPRELDWHSGIVFTNLDPTWRPVYARDTNAVVIERRILDGTVVIATDSYFLSNEALRRDRQPEFLAWLLGENSRVIFDEAHFGIVEQSGVVMLMRQYRLHWLAAGLVLLAGLFIWKNAVSLAPPSPEDAPQEMVRGKDSAAGFANLLRRSIRPGELLETCFREWKNSAAKPGVCSARRMAEAQLIFETEKALPRKNRDPVQAYRQIAAALALRAGSKSEPEKPDIKENEQRPT